MNDYPREVDPRATTEKPEAELSVDPEFLEAPSERDRAIYEAICINCRPAGEVGEEMGLAATTVRNIALDVQRKMARRLHRLERMTTADSLKAYHDRLHSQLGQVSGAWAASRRDREVTHKLKYKSGEERDRTCVMKQAGDARLMNLATKISREMHAIEHQFRLHQEDEAERAKQGKVPREERRRQQILEELEDLNLRREVLRSVGWNLPAMGPTARDATPAAPARRPGEATNDTNASQTRHASDAPQAAAEQGLAPRWPSPAAAAAVDGEPRALATGV